jgi:hypothetical protein
MGPDQLASQSERRSDCHAVLHEHPRQRSLLRHSVGGTRPGQCQWAGRACAHAHSLASTKIHERQIYLRRRRAQARMHRSSCAAPHAPAAPAERHGQLEELGRSAPSRSTRGPVPATHHLTEIPIQGHSNCFERLISIWSEICVACRLMSPQAARSAVQSRPLTILLISSWRAAYRAAHRVHPYVNNPCVHTGMSLILTVVHSFVTNIVPVGSLPPRSMRCDLVLCAIPPSHACADIRCSPSSPLPRRAHAAMCCSVNGACCDLLQY